MALKDAPAVRANQITRHLHDLWGLQARHVLEL
jgi:hypothetical protein